MINLCWMLLRVVLTVWLLAYGAQARLATQSDELAAAQISSSHPRNRMLLQVNDFSKCIGPRVTLVGDSDPGYELIRERAYFINYLLNRFPKAYVQPKATRQVARVMKCLAKLDLPFVVRSGGHSIAGLSIIDKGIVVDTSKMVKIRVNRGRSTAWVDAGVRLGALYRHLWLYGPKKFFPGGVCPSVGLSGQLQSGGHGIPIRKYGFGADSVLAATVVTADGKTLYASKKKNKDMFFSIRGGSANCGVITKWKLKMYDAPDRFTALYIDISWDLASLKKFFGLFFEAKPWNWPVNVAEIRVNVASAANFCRLVIGYLGPKWKLEKFMKKTPFFTKAQPYTISKFTELSWIEEQIAQANFSPVEPASTSLDDFTQEALVSSWYDNATPATVPGRLNTLISPYLKWDGMPQAGADIIAETFFNENMFGLFAMFGGLSSSPKGRSIAYIGTNFPGNIAMGYYFPENTRASKREGDKFINNLRTKLAPYTQTHQYFGYISANLRKTEDPWEVYFGKNAAKLKKIKAKYDPKGRFNVFTRNERR